MGIFKLNGVNYMGGGGGTGDANYEELTQVEYDALTTEEKNNGTMYFITDADGDGQDFQPVIYSENEREIGVWTDGKPLYQRTFVFSETIIASYGGWTSTGIDATSFDTIIEVITLANGQTWKFSALKDNNLVKVVNPYNGAIGFDKLILRYTKTTDAPGSGTWTPQGVPAVHYSTEEKVVGTWIDGSTIYEKTFKIDNPTSTINPSTLVNLTNNEVVIDIQGYLEASDGSRLYNNFGDSTDYQLKLWFEVGAIKYRAKYGSSSLTEITFSIQYIKTSS